MTMSPQEFLNIPNLNQENSKTTINESSSRTNYLHQNSFISNNSSRNSSSIIFRRKSNRLSTVNKQNLKIDTGCNKSATLKYNLSSNQLNVSDINKDNYQSSRIKNPPKSPLKPDLKPIKKPKKTCVVNDIFYSMLRVDDLISSQPASSETHKQMTTIKSYLKQYSDIFKKTQKGLLQMEIKEADNLSQLTLFFNKLRKELDFKEELLKIKYKSMVNSYETSLRMDLEFLEKKCKHLCEVIDSYSQQSKTPTKSEPNLSEDFMNNYNLESILLKEKAGTYKLLNKKFTIHTETSFQCPTVECDFRRVKSFIDEIDVISHSTTKIPDLKRDTLDSFNKEENSSKGSDTGRKTHCSVRLEVGMLEENENSEISSESGNRSVDITPSQRKH